MTRRAHRPTMLRLYRELTRSDQRLAEGLPDAELVIVSGADHLLCLSHARHLSALLRDFLRRKEPAAVSGAAAR